RSGFTLVEWTAAEVQRGLQQFYASSDTRHRSPHVSDVVLLGSGYETDVFAFSLTPDGESQVQELVLRVYARQGASEKAAREFAAMRRLREVGYPVPRVLSLHGDASPFGRPVVIMERIHGVALWQAHG